MMPWRTISASARIGLPLRIATRGSLGEIRRDAQVVDDVGHAAGVNDAGGDGTGAFGQPR